MLLSAKNIHISLSLSLLITTVQLHAQIPPAIQWQNTIGGNAYEFLWAVNSTADGGTIMAGYSNSGISGDKTENTVSFHDIWVVKINAAGAVQWENTIGGADEDQAFDAIQTNDGGYLVCGMSQSGISGDKTEPNLGNADMWIIKLNSAGAIEWQNTIGGAANDQAQIVRQLADGNYIIGGWSSSGISGDKTEANIGGGFSTDYWLVKIDTSGNIMWQNTVGGSAYEYLYALETTADGGFIAGGVSESGISGDKTENTRGSFDYWVVKVNSAGIIQWDKTIGGLDADNLLSITTTFDGGYALAGNSWSDITGDKTEVSPGAFSDYWVVKINSTGSIMWQTSLGGNNDEYALDIDESTEHGLIVGGTSYSGISGDKTEAMIGNGDMWIVKLNATGSIYWQNAIGGNQLDNCRSLYQAPSDSTFIIAGMSVSGISGDKTEANLGFASSDDYWILKLNRDCFPTAEICNNMDDNCNGYKDDDLPFFDYYTDADTDGYGDIGATPVNWCADIPGKVLDHTDCNDANASVNPAMEEICNGLDENCNAENDEGLIFITYYPDADTDGYGNFADPGISSCSIVAGTVTNNTDCNDANNMVNPAGNETCNGIDDNCDASVDEGIILTISISAGGATTFCQGGSVLLSATYSGASIQWQKNGSNIAGATSSTYSVTKSGNYSAVTTSPCGTATSSTISVTVNKNPNASITAGGPTSFCAGGSVTLTETPQAGCTYQWYKGANPIPGATGLNYVATVGGNYKCRVTKTATGCYKNSNAISVTVPCKEGEWAVVSGEMEFNIYPNPNNGTFEISVQNLASAKSHLGGFRPARMNRSDGGLNIYNSLGQLIYTQQINSSDNNFTETIELNNISSGIYFIQISDGVNSSQEKLIIQ